MPSIGCNTPPAGVMWLFCRRRSRWRVQFAARQLLRRAIRFCRYDGPPSPSPNGRPRRANVQKQMSRGTIPRRQSLSLADGIHIQGGSTHPASPSAFPSRIGWISTRSSRFPRPRREKRPSCDCVGRRFRRKCRPLATHARTKGKGFRSRPYHPPSSNPLGSGREPATPDDAMQSA